MGRALSVNSARQQSLGLMLLTIGFCTDLAGEEKLRAAGVDRIWRRGDSTQSLDDALYEFRGRAGARRMTREIQEGEYHIVRDSKPTSYPYDVMRRIRGQDYRINSFGTEIHARYFAAAQSIANTPSQAKAVDEAHAVGADRAEGKPEAPNGVETVSRLDARRSASATSEIMDATSRERPAPSIQTP